MGKIPTLEKVMTMEAEIAAPHDPGQGLGIFNVPSGSITGDDFTAKLIAPSGDWSRARSETVMQLDVRASAMLEDGSYMYLTYPGRVVMNEAVLAKMAAREEIDGSEMYFTTTPSVDTNSPNHMWMNDTMFVGQMQKVTFPTPEKNGYLRYEIYKIV